mgnify:CR=1 FL=1|tara:strand:- start:541 stop:1272 length:732 start_codon:yes stop_codon:yes gene_type:complete
MNCHNGQKFLKESINSVYDQTYKNWEIIFVDNMSEDNTAEIAKSYDNKLKYFRTYDFLSLYRARNFALRKCNGNLITFLDSDDIWYKNKLEIQVEVHRLGCEFSFGEYEIYDSINQKKLYFKVPKIKRINTNFLISKNIISIGCVMVNSDLLKNNKFDPYYELLGDFDLWIRLSKITKIKKINQCLEISRLHKKNFSKLLKHRWLKERRYFYFKFLKENSFIKHPNIFLYILICEIKGFFQTV